MPKNPSPRKRNKSAHHRAKLKAKHTKQRQRAAGELSKKNGGRRLRH